MRYRLPLVLFLLLFGCAMVQQATPPTPKTVRQGIYLANYEIAAVMNAASDSYEQGLISADALKTALEGSRKAKVSLSLATEASDAGDMQTAQAQLQATRAVLQAIRELVGGER